MLIGIVKVSILLKKMQSGAERSQGHLNKTKDLPLWISQEEVSSVLSQTKHAHFYHHLNDTGSPHI